MNKLKKEETALFRFGIVFPLIGKKDSDGSLRSCIKQICSKEYDIPYSSRKILSEATVLSWYYKYIKTRSLESLMPKDRKDVGKTRTVDLESANELVQRHIQNPDVPLTTIVSQMADEGLDMRMHSAYRLISSIKKSNPNSVEKDQRRFEMEHCNDVWMLDAMTGPKVIVEEGSKTKYVTSHCFAFMDDSSRLVTHAQFYTNEKAESLLDCMWKAFSKRGLPVRVYTDNGSAMRDFRLKYGLASLEVHLSYAKAYHPQGKAKLERFWRTLRMQFLPTLPQEITLYDLNKKLDKWIDEYNSRWHSAINMAPLEKYVSDIEVVRSAPMDMPSLFRFRTERVVSSARTVSFNKRTLEVPIGYGGKHIELRYFSSDGEVEAFYDNQSIGVLGDVDLIHNGRTYRTTTIGEDKDDK